MSIIMYNFEYIYISTAFWTKKLNMATYPYSHGPLLSNMETLTLSEPCHIDLKVVCINIESDLSLESAEKLCMGFYFQAIILIF